MAGQVSVQTKAEMHKRSGECMLKIRSELSRIGCSSDELLVMRRGRYLQLTYQQQQVALVAPYEVLSLLHKIPRGTCEAEVWAQIANQARRVEKSGMLTRGWLITVVTSLIAMAAFLVFFKNI